MKEQHESSTESLGAQEFERSLKKHTPLAPFTTLGIGGPARYFAEVASAQSLRAGVEWARSRSLPLFILGGGSNVVISDGGFAGLVLRLSIRGIRTSIDGDRAIVEAGAGEEWDSLVALAVGNDWVGFESLSGIPGRVGATPIQNVGAYGQETSDTLLWLEALDLATVEMVRMRSEDCRFGYRASRFKTSDQGRYVITSVAYQLRRGGLPVIRYGELQRYLADKGASQPDAAQVRSAVLAIRRRKAMVIDAADPDSRSVGSFFVNPVVTNEEFERVKAQADRIAESGSAMPAFPAADGSVKLSAAWLIEQAGFKRGHVHGNVGTSTKHALAIINRGGGTAREVAELAEQIKARVFDAFGVRLTPEPVFVGFDP